MRRGAWLGVMLWVAACSRLNPEFDQGGQDGSGGQSGTGGSTDGTSAPTLDSADAESLGTDGGDTKGSDSGGPPSPRCAADLYAINDMGALYLLDLDGPRSIAVGEGDAFQSWALATEPGTGDLIASALGEPSMLRRIEPLNFGIDMTPIMVPIETDADFARATFDGGGSLWLGTDATSEFLSFVIGDVVSTPYPIVGTGTGGDMVFVAAGLALVPAENGLAHLVDLEEETVLTTPVVGVTESTIFTGVAYDREDRLWASVAEHQGRLHMLELSGVGTNNVEVAAVARVEVEVRINDLAPIRVLPGGC